MSICQKNGETYTLGSAQTAEPNTCGSCAFFLRRTHASAYDNGGDCRLVPPPQFAAKWDLPSKRSEDDEYYPSYTEDTSTCDLYRSSGSGYTKQINWRAP